MYTIYFVLTVNTLNNTAYLCSCYGCVVLYVRMYKRDMTCNIKVLCWTVYLRCLWNWGMLQKTLETVHFSLCSPIWHFLLSSLVQHFAILSSTLHIGQIRLSFTASCLHRRLSWFITSLGSLKMVLLFFPSVAICYTFSLYQA